MGRLIRESPESNCITKIGGHPSAVADFAWPTCRSCAGAMQFIAQIKLAETNIPEFTDRTTIALIFQCQNDPGMCDDWDADGGGNIVLLVDPGDEIVAAPEGETALPKESLVALSNYDSSISSQTPDDNYVSSYENDQSVIGKLAGHPVWIQADETPNCPCGESMTFVAMLEERGGGGINFGGAGAGYAFACATCAHTAKFLWQS